MSSASLIYPFDSGIRDPNLLGGKGSSLARMAALGITVPTGFTISTDAWRYWRDGGGILGELEALLRTAMSGIEADGDQVFGDPTRPLLVSVRSGAAISMPGMMDTILNVGLTDEIAAAMSRAHGDAFGYTIYDRLLASFTSIVRGIDPADVERVDALPAGRDRIAAWQGLLAARGEPFPQNPYRQLAQAVCAVWRSWDTPRAKRYRRYRGVADDLGTAVTVQRMVFGNLDESSGTGVAFTRDPATGAGGVYGDFLPGAQGEDVVCGAVTPEPLAEAAERMHSAFDELTRQMAVLEKSYRDMCDIEFTIESGRTWILQARVGQRSGPAAMRIATDLVAEGVLDVEEALARIPVSAMQQLRAPVRVEDPAAEVVGTGLPASPGTGVGHAVFDAQRAEALADAGKDVVLLRPETSPDDVGGVIAARGVVTATGGRTSHAAVVARGLGRPAVCGVDGLTIDPRVGMATFPSGAHVEEGDLLTVDGSEGAVLMGAAELAVPTPAGAVEQVLDWCASECRVPVLAEIPQGAATVGGPEDVHEGIALAAIDIDWEGSTSTALLGRVCAELIGAGCPSWVLVVPASLRGADLKPPAGPWTGVVAPGTNEWAGRLLATRIEVRSTP